METRLTLNYKLDEPSINGRVYTKEVWEHGVEKALKRGNGIMIYSNVPSDYNTPDILNAIGVVQRFNIEGNELTADCKIFSDSVKPFVNSLKLTTAGIGKCNPERELTYFDLEYCYLVKGEE